MSDDPNEYLRSNPDLGPLVEAHGPVTVTPADDLFERFIMSIVSQQISTAAADAIRARLREAVTITPTAILDADEAVLREAGLSGQKTKYIRNVARAFDDYGYDHDWFAGMENEAVVEELTAITGVGPWSAKMLLISGLGREDVFPVEDLGIRRGMEDLYGDLSRAEMVDRAEAWKPYRSYASRYLWKSVDG